MCLKIKRPTTVFAAGKIGERAGGNEDKDLAWKNLSFHFSSVHTCITAIRSLASSTSEAFFLFTAVSLVSHAFLMTSSLPRFDPSKSRLTVSFSSSADLNLTSVIESWEDLDSSVNSSDDLKMSLPCS